MDQNSNKLNPELFLELAHSFTILDVRSPKEYHQGHIPGAKNMPLFSDDERAVVGTAYKKKGKDTALVQGLEFVGPKMADFVKTARKLAKKNKILVHCWRGGMRSEAMAWLFRLAGIETHVLEGGYKAYRRHIRESFASGPQMILLGGMTGSGKTELLQFLEARGEQVIDLEALARHKGSAFGSLGQPEQPTNEQFENDLAARWLSLDPEKPVWLEDESRNVGKVGIPDPLFTRMIQADLVFIDVPFEERVERLTREYGNFDKDILASIIEKISKRMGSEIALSARMSLDCGDVMNAISMVLKYYDKTYRYGLSKRAESKITKISYPEYRTTFSQPGMYMKYRSQ